MSSSSLFVVVLNIMLKITYLYFEMHVLSTIQRRYATHERVGRLCNDAIIVFWIHGEFLSKPFNTCNGLKFRRLA